MKKRKMTITVLGCMGIFLIAAFVLMPSVQAGEETFKYKVVSHTTKVKVSSGKDLRLAQADILDELPEEGATGKTTGTVEDTIDEVEGKSTETKVLKLRYIEYATGFTAGPGRNTEGKLGGYNDGGHGDFGGDTGGDSGGDAGGGSGGDADGGSSGDADGGSGGDADGGSGGDADGDDGGGKGKGKGKGKK